MISVVDAMMKISSSVLLVAWSLSVILTGNTVADITLRPQSPRNWTIAEACAFDIAVGSFTAYMMGGNSTEVISPGGGITAYFRPIRSLNNTSNLRFSYERKTLTEVSIRVNRSPSVDPLPPGRYWFEVGYVYTEPVDSDNAMSYNITSTQYVEVVPEFSLLVHKLMSGAVVLSASNDTVAELTVVSRNGYPNPETNYFLISENPGNLKYFQASETVNGSGIIYALGNDVPFETFVLEVTANVTAPVDGTRHCFHVVNSTVTITVLPRITITQANLINNTALNISWDTGGPIFNYTITVFQGASYTRQFSSSSTTVILSPLPPIPSGVTVTAINVNGANTTSEVYLLNSDTLRPGPPMQVTAVLNPNDLSLMVSWEPPSPAGDLNYTIIIRTIGGNLRFPVGPGTLHIAIDLGLQSKNIMMVSVQASNIIGVSEESVEVVPTVLEITMETVVLTNTEIIIISCVCGSLVVFLAIFIICSSAFIFKHCWKWKHRVYQIDQVKFMSSSETVSTLNRSHVNDDVKTNTLPYSQVADFNHGEVIRYTTGNNSLVISKMHHNRPLPQPPEEPIYVDIPKEHLDQFELGMRVKRLASTTSTFRPLWNPFTGQLTVRGAPDGGGVAEPALKILGHRVAVPDDYDKEEVYNTFEKIYHADATGNSLLSSFEFKSEQITMLNQIGQGEFGRVYKAIARSIVPGEKETLVAVKILKENSTEQAAKDFLAEAQLLAHFGHPYVLSLLGVCTRDAPIMVLTPFFSNGNLKNFLRKLKSSKGDTIGDREIHQLLQMAEQIATGMEYLASKFFIHRDLAARNILVGDNLTCVISDFGMCRVIARGDVHYVMKTGNKVPLKWMALESLQYMKFSTYSDVWSFGVVMWEIASLGESPMRNIPSGEVLTFLSGGQRMGKPLHCSDAMYNLMLECWSEDPSKRPLFTHLRSKLNALRKMLHHHSLRRNSDGEYAYYI